LPEPNRILVSPQHRCVKPAIVLTLEDLLPFIECRNPCVLLLPSMQICNAFGTYLTRRTSAYNRKRDRPPEFIQLLVRKPTSHRRTERAFGEFQLITLTHTPGFE